MPQLRRVFWLTLFFGCAACDVYDDGDFGSPLSDSGGTIADACTGSAEICNGHDDDCDGKVDEQEAVTAACESRFHAASACESGLCVKVGLCHSGFYNCDGMPDNGCESTCDCRSNCKDPDDAGGNGS
jgi:hypothetical protein